jgi:hypothetical protein
VPNSTPFVKDAFHDYVICGRRDAINPEQIGTKCAAHFDMTIEPRETRQVYLRLWSADLGPERFFGKEFETVFAERQHEADEFYNEITASTRSRAQKCHTSGLRWTFME